MAGLSWWDKLDRQTEGLDWQFNNAFGGTLCLGANYAVLSVVVCVVSLLAASSEHPDRESGFGERDSGGTGPGTTANPPREGR
jgi:hypothetical protein